MHNIPNDKSAYIGNTLVQFFSKQSKGFTKEPLQKKDL